MRTVVHQHLLAADLMAALGRRTSAPRITRGRLHPAGEPPSPFDPADHDPDARAGLDDVDRIVISLSSALGIESAAPPAAAALGDAVMRALGVNSPGRAFSGRATVAVPA